MKNISRIIIIISLVIICFYSNATESTNENNYGQVLFTKITINNGHFPDGNITYGVQKRLIVEGIPSVCRLKIAEGYHILYGGLFSGTERIKNYGGETILKTLVGREEKEYFADNRVDGYHIFDTHPYQGELKLVLIKHILDKNGYIQRTSDGSILSERITPKEKEVIIDYIIEDAQTTKAAVGADIRSPMPGVRWKEIIGPNTVQQYDVQYTDCPIHIKTQEGHVFCVARYKDSKTFKGFILAISDDWGTTFTYKKILLSEYPFGSGDYPTLVFDEKKKILFLFSNNKYITSSDYGKTFSSVRTVDVDTRCIIRDSECSDPIITTSGGNGIILSNGIICIPMNVLQFYASDGVGHTKKECKKAQCFVLYSKNHGKTWKQTPLTSDEVFAWEFSVAEYKRGKLMINARGGNEESQKRTTKGRRIYTSTVNRVSRCGWKVKGWKLDSSDGTIWDPICNASFVKAKIGGKTIGLYSSPYIPGHYAPRINLTLQASSDFRHWTPICQLTKRYKVMQGYTSLDATGGRVTVVACEQFGKGILFAELDNITIY